MDSTLFTTFDGWIFLTRWLHYFFGMIWIGHLYYFNFTQGPWFTETDPTTKSNAIQKLVPRALWWFRWGAMGTFLTGLIILSLKYMQNGWAVFESAWGITILTGATLGSLMWANVWFIIWPKQKIVIASATQVAKGGQAIADAAGAGARAGVASRTNVLFSIPMLFFMGAASHLALSVGETSRMFYYFIIFLILLIILEWNAIKGKTGLMTTVQGVITCGFALTALLYILMRFLI